MAEVYETATFYHHFDVMKPKEAAIPPLTIRVCESLSCEMFGAKELFEDYKIKYKSDIRIQKIPCVGRCDRAPVAIAGTNPIEYATYEKIENAVARKDFDIALPEYINYIAYRNSGGYQTLIDCVNNDHKREKIVKIMEIQNSEDWEVRAFL